jgi:hypothetical protein
VTAFADLVPGTPIGPFSATVSAAANERYWRAAGVDHPALAAGALYPPIAANLTILAFGRTCTDAMIQSRQRIVCHRRADAGQELTTMGTVTARYERRGRAYVDVRATVCTADGDVVWTSELTFTPTATLKAAR